jgi:hypothetical protein
MPNWCDNKLTISGSEEEIRAFVEKAKGRDHKFVGPFNSIGREREIDWEDFTPIKLDILLEEDPDFFLTEDASPLSFHALVPVPKWIAISPYDEGVFEKRRAEYGEWFAKFPDITPGYRWEIDNWGVKWGASDSEVVDLVLGDGEDSEVIYSFQTPWGPPIKFLSTVAAKFPNLNFLIEYSEAGMGFAGEIEWEDGSKIRENEWEFSEEGNDEE